MGDINVSIEVDTRDFEQALRKTLQQTSRDIPDVINSAAIDIITAAAKYTKKADKSLISDSLLRPVTPIKGARPGRPASIIYLMLNAKQRKSGQAGLNNSDMSNAAKALIKKRSAAIGFIAYAGWQKALLAFGGRGFGSKAQKTGFETSSASRGRGIKARIGSLFALMSNTAEACDKYGKIPLEMAFWDKTRRMMEHLEEKLKKRCDEANKR